MSAPQTECLLRAGLTHSQWPLQPPRAASREIACSFREKDERITNLIPGNNKVAIFGNHN